MRSRLLAIGLALACAAVPVMAAAPGNEAEWTRAVQRRLISRLDYPKEAHRLSGPISLSLKITALRNGTIYDVVVSRSSGDAAVDQAAVAMVRRAGPLPAFPDAMTQEKTELMLPLRFQQEDDTAPATDRGPPADIPPRRYVDAATGFSVTVPSPLRAGPAPTRGRYDAQIEISSPDDFPPRARDARYLCRIGFQATQAGVKPPAAPAPSAQVAAAERRQRRLGGSIELYDRFTLDGAQGLDYLAAPGPSHPDTLHYYADIVLPQGRVRMACATQRDAMPAAMTMFRQVRDGIAARAR
ncbi:TonB family protein [Achromobacter dolens]|uniref:TonB family protein n=1 Tax=Achromobacter dolens TaxID=1287738 RepID=UPI0022B8932A|nr:TonB family protein [Achromobacter dolens]MCZ8406674.1 TonB family protein [Achromobacter dolens]